MRRVIPILIVAVVALLAVTASGTVDARDAPVPAAAHTETGHL